MQTEIMIALGALALIVFAMILASVSRKPGAREGTADGSGASFVAVDGGGDSSCGDGGGGGCD